MEGFEHLSLVRHLFGQNVGLATPRIISLASLTTNRRPLPLATLHRLSSAYLDKAKVAARGGIKEVLMPAGPTMLTAAQTR